MSKSDHTEFKSIIESLLFAWGEPINVSKLSKILALKPSVVEAMMQELIEQYKLEKRGIQIIETNKHYQFATRKENYCYIEQLCATTKSRGLSNSALEVLAVIAYKQPITKLDIEQIRGVNSDGPLQNLVERELVEVVGKLEKIGRPQIFGTTDVFLKSFGFKDLSELPQVEAFKSFEALMMPSDEEQVEFESGGVNDTDQTNEEIG